MIINIILKIFESVFLKIDTIEFCLYELYEYRKTFT